MKQYHVNWSPQSLEELRAIYNFIYEQSPQGADKVLNTLLDLGESLMTFPERFPTDTNVESTHNTFRCLPKWNYKILYSINHNTAVVNIAKVVSTRQDPDSLKLI